MLATYVTAGSDPVVHAIYRARGTNALDAVLREIVVGLSSGDVVRDRQFAIEARPAQPVYPCGAEGLAQLLGGPGFTYTQSRTGKRASAIVVDGQGANVSLRSDFGPVLTWSSGWMVVKATDQRQLVGFQCALATP